MEIIQMSKRNDVRNAASAANAVATAIHDAKEEANAPEPEIKVVPLTGDIITYKDQDGNDATAQVPADISAEVVDIFKKGASLDPVIASLTKELAEKSAWQGNALLALARKAIQRCNMDVSAGLNVFQGACSHAESAEIQRQKTAGVEKPSISSVNRKWSADKSAVVTALTPVVTKAGVVVKPPVDLFAKLHDKTGKPVIEPETGEQPLAFATLSALKAENYERRKAREPKSPAAEIHPDLQLTTASLTAVLGPKMARLIGLLNVLDLSGLDKAAEILNEAIIKVAEISEGARNYLVAENARIAKAAAADASPKAVAMRGGSR
jgi:hypothetical protein